MNISRHDQQISNITDALYGTQNHTNKYVEFYEYRPKTKFGDNNSNSADATHKKYSINRATVINISNCIEVAVA